MELNLAKTVVGYLKAHADEKFTARQIAEWVFATYPEQCQAKKQSSQRLETDAELVQQIVREISSQLPRLQKKNLELKTTEGRPRKHYYSERSDSAEVAAVESEGAAATSAEDEGPPKIDEHALYPLLSQYLWEEFGVFSKHRFEESGVISRKSSDGFAGYALKKMTDELKAGARSDAR